MSDTRDKNSSGLTFAGWLGRVDHELIRVCGLTHDCLADFPSWDLWADDVEPVEAAQVCLADWNDFPADLLD